MSQVALPPIDDLHEALHPYAVRDPEGRLHPEAGNELLRLWNAIPDQAARLFRHHFELWRGSVLGPRITELMRLAVANETRCPV